MDQLTQLKSYIADTVIWVPVFVAVISLVAAWGDIAIKHWLSIREERQWQYRKERIEAYQKFITLLHASLTNTTRVPGTVLSYEELCRCYNNFPFWTALGLVQLIAPDNIQVTCGEIHRVLGGEKVVTREELLSLFAKVHEQMIEDVRQQKRSSFLHLWLDWWRNGVSQ